MKKRLFPLLLILVLLLSACTAAEEPDPVYTIEKDGMAFTVDTASRTITHGSDVYQYTTSKETNGITYTIHYPDGAQYYMVCKENLRYGGWSDGYDVDHHLDGDILIDILQEKAPQKHPSREKDAPNIFLGLGLIMIGIIDLIWPHSTWYHEHGWFYKYAEPSDIALNLIQACGMIAIIGGIILFIVGIV